MKTVAARRWVSVMAKPAGSACNLRCEYCYYSGKADTGQKLRSRDIAGMKEDLLREYVRQYISAQSAERVDFVWHGGEPTLLPISFYRRAMAFQREYGEGRQINNILQTNGISLTQDWCRFLVENNWLVGISIDGPSDFHDEYRRNASGYGTHARVVRSIDMLKRYGVEWNAMAVVNDYNSEYPEEFYDFFKDIGCQYLQFTPIVERKDKAGKLMSGMNSGGAITPQSVTPERWGEFLIGVFDRWVRRDVGKVFVQLFDATLANWVGLEPGVCTMAPECGHALVMEQNGDVYSCDHFVFEDYLLGNIQSVTLADMAYSERQIRFGQSKHSELHSDCRHCEWLRLCNGECPRMRFANQDASGRYKNYLCEGYKQFFSHTAPYFRYMANELSRRQSPANIMSAIERGEKF